MPPSPGRCDTCTMRSWNPGSAICPRSAQFCGVSSSSDTLDGVSGRHYYARVGGSPPCVNRRILIRPS